MEMMVTAKAIALFIAGTVAPHAPAYQAGQIWEYHTRAIDAGSLLKIQKIESDPEATKYGPIYHISVVGVHLFGQPAASAIAHLPVSRSVLDESVTRLVTSDAAFPDADEGIASWREAKGGVFTIPVDEIVMTVDDIAAQGRVMTNEGVPPS
jgi:hypothetical protein